MFFLWNSSRSPQQIELQPVYVNSNKSNKRHSSRNNNNRVRFSDKTALKEVKHKDLTPLIDSEVSYVRFDPSDTYTTVDEYLVKPKRKTQMTTRV